MVTLAISDVVGDRLGDIGSGPTEPDRSTASDAIRIIDYYRLREKIPDSVLYLLQRSEPRGALESNGESLGQVIASNRQALAAAAECAHRQGWRAHVLPQALEGDSKKAARRFINEALAIASSDPEQQQCVIAGGETTVEVVGGGRGGRNQEFALAVARKLHHASRPLLLLSAGSDGIDGPTDAAGAFVDSDSYTRAVDRGLQAKDYLASNDSYSYFDAIGDLLRCGPTGTNVADIKIALLPST